MASSITPVAAAMVLTLASKSDQLCAEYYEATTGTGIKEEFVKRLVVGMREEGTSMDSVVLVGNTEGRVALRAGLVEGTFATAATAAADCTLV